MHTEVLTRSARNLFSSLSAFKDSFYLAGGTGLALQFGHRVSVDFDLFSDESIKKTLLKTVEEKYKDSSLAILISTKNELSILIEGVKFTFLHYPFPVLLPLERSGPIPILSAEEILVAKAYTIGRRGEFKDYVDLYVGIKRGYSSISEIITLAQRKYGEAFNDRLFLEQLVYLDDVNEVEITMASDIVPTKAELIEYFSSLIRHEQSVG
jgi:hypothetical protein